MQFLDPQRGAPLKCSVCAVQQSVALQENAPQWPPPQYAPRPPLRLEEHQREAGNGDPFAQVGWLSYAVSVCLPEVYGIVQRDGRGMQSCGIRKGRLCFHCWLSAAGSDGLCAPLYGKTDERAARSGGE